MKSVLFVIALSASSLVMAQQDGHADHNAMHNGNAAMHSDHGSMHGDAAIAMTSGVLNSVDAKKGMVNVSHGPIPEFNWPPMTMNLKVENMGVVKNIKPGSNVHFALKKLSAVDYVIVEMTAEEHAGH